MCSSSLGDIVKILQKQLEDNVFIFVVRRGSVLTHALTRMDRLGYTPTKKIEVSHQACTKIEYPAAEEIASILLHS